MNDETSMELIGAATDRIFLREHIVEVEIGAYPEEYGATQRLRFSVDLDVRRSRDGDQDEVADVVSYDLIFAAIHDIAAGPRMKLLETFAERLAARLLAEKGVMRARIRVEKLDRVSGALGVEIDRRSAR